MRRMCGFMEISIRKFRWFLMRRLSGVDIILSLRKRYSTNAARYIEKTVKYSTLKRFCIGMEIGNFEKTNQ